MQLSLEVDAHLLDRLAQGSLVSMDVGDVEGVDVNIGCWAQARAALTFLSTSAPG